jgi:hypothetical protein
MITDDPTSAFYYSLASWTYHSRKACRKLGLNKRILEFAKDGLESSGTTIEDDRLVDYFRDILILCQEDIVS